MFSHIKRLSLQRLYGNLALSVETPEREIYILASYLPSRTDFDAMVDFVKSRTQKRIDPI